ncbi:MAG TPA: ABC transporter permease [Gammaproteobacteria bacterium]|nr:ABC transporter permease [Gammaproteobacteria bacterium]
MNRILSFLSHGAEWRSTLRGLARRPSYAIAAWIMLGLAAAANGAVFAIVYGFMLKPLPYAQPGNLSMIRETLPKVGLGGAQVSVKDYLRLKSDVGGIANAGLAWADGAPVKIGNRTHLIGYEEVTPSLFRTLGVSPLIGRLPAANADKPGGPQEAVISWRLWHNSYNGNRSVLGKALKLNDTSYTIVGVMPRDFLVEVGSLDAWVPFVITPKRARDDNINYWMIARRKVGVSEHQLDVELTNERNRLLAATTPQRRARSIRDGFRIDARPLRQVELDQFGVGHLPWLLQAAAALLLLLALANTINLGLVRQRSRQHEFALRRALGATRFRLSGLIVLEHLPIIAAVGLIATALSAAATGALHAFGLPPVFSPFTITLAPAVVVFTWVLTLVSVLAVTAGPAILASGRRLLATLGHGPTDAGGKLPKKLQRGLGITQVALACALLVSGGLLGVSLWRVLSQPLGFQSRHRVAAMMILPHSLNNTAAWSAIRPQLRKLPGISRVSATDMLPFSQIGSIQSDVSPLGKSDSNQRVTANSPAVSADFFATMGIRFVAGRPFTPEEVSDHASVIVVNANLARKFFGSAANALGKQLDFHGNPRIVGVTRDIAWQPTRGDYNPGTVYETLGSNGNNLMSIVVRSQAPAGPMMRMLKRGIQQALPSGAIIRIATLPEMVRGASVFRAAGAGIVGAFAALALFLAALGVFSITAFIARTRLGEYGVRAALGAAPSTLLRFGFKEAVWLLGIGLPIGLVCAWLLGQAIADALYRTPVLNVGLYLAGVAIVTCVVFAAAWGPARRAARTPIRNLIGGNGTQ